MARTPRTSNPVSLFPFLAVLLCTIGALVLLLVVVASGIRREAVATAAKQAHDPGVEEPEPSADIQSVEPLELAAVSGVESRPIDPLFAVEPPESPISAAEPERLAELAELELFAKELKSRLQSRTRQLESIEQKKKALAQQLQLASSHHVEMQQALVRTISDRNELDQRLNELKIENRQMVELLDQSDELIKEQQKHLASPKHSIIPYDGQTGTVRRPIIVECRDNVIRFEAEGVEISYRDLKRFSPEQNPLRSGVTALAAYWVEHDRRADPGRRPTKPYALILVRPSGADAFQSALFALDELVGDFGYELVEDHFEYEVPETTAEAERVCRAAVEATLRAGPVKSRRVLNPSGPIDIGRVARAPAASRGFFASKDFRNRTSGGDSTDADASGVMAGSTGAGSQDNHGRAGEPRAGSSGTSASSNLNRAFPGTQRGGRAGERDGEGQEIGNLLANIGNVLNRPASPQRSATSAQAGVGSQVRNQLGENISGRFPRVPASGVGHSEDLNGNERTGDVRGSLSNENRSESGGARSEVAAPGSPSLIPGVARGSALSGQEHSQGRTSAGNTGAGQTNSGIPRWMPLVTAREMSGQQDSAQPGGTANATAKSQSTSVSHPGSTSGSSGAGGPASAGSSGPSMPVIRRGEKKAPQKPERRWGLSRPEASLGLEKVAEITVENGRVVIADQLQVTRRPELSESEIAARTVLALEHVAKEWGWPPRRFYWVPSVRLSAESGEERLAQIIRDALEKAGAGFEH